LVSRTVFAFGESAGDVGAGRRIGAAAGQVVLSGLAFLQNLRRGHYTFATETPRKLRIAVAFTELAMAI
jgi:hypothetical protein